MLGVRRSATLQIVARSAGGDWRCQQAPVAARVGRSGVRPLAERRSGDGTTPAGSFPLGSVQAWDGQRFEFFGNRADPGVRGSYRDRAPTRTAGEPRPTPPRISGWSMHPAARHPSEWLTSIGEVYGHAAVIGANLDPISGDAAGEPALAAAIFLHRNSYSPSGASRADQRLRVAGVGRPRVRPALDRSQPRGAVRHRRAFVAA